MPSEAIRAWRESIDRRDAGPSSDPVSSGPLDRSSVVRSSIGGPTSSRSARRAADPLGGASCARNRVSHRSLRDRSPCPTFFGVLWTGVPRARVARASSQSARRSRPPCKTSECCYPLAGATMQAVGRTCATCEEKIRMATDGVGCGSCRVAYHHACLRDDDGHCPKCRVRFGEAENCRPIGTRFGTRSSFDAAARCSASCSAASRHSGQLPSC
jgi:hypothetical protein